MDIKWLVIEEELLKFVGYVKVVVIGRWLEGRDKFFGLDLGPVNTAEERMMDQHRPATRAMAKALRRIHLKELLV